MTIDNLYESMYLEDLAVHNLVNGHFFIANQLGPGSVYRIVNEAVPGFELLTVDAEHARVTCDLLNVAVSQLDFREPAVFPKPQLSPIQRAAKIGALLHGLRAERAVLEATAGDASAGKSVNQHAVSGSAEALRHDKLTADIDRLERELAGLEG